MIRIDANERAAFIGATGTGKTVLAKFLLGYLDRCIVIDPKHTFKLDGYKRGWTLPWLGNKFRIIVRPKPSDDERLAALLWEAYQRRNVTIYVDELASLEDRFPETIDILQEIARTGRERKVGLWSAMQRPRWVPRIFLTESETFFVFALRSKDDRANVAGFIGGESDDRKIPFHFFWYVRPEEENPALMKLNIETGEVEEFSTEEIEEPDEEMEELTA
jgi:hypothetical protein